MSITKEDKHSIYDILYQAAWNYNMKLIKGHSIDEKTLKGQALKKEDVLQIKSPDEHLNYNTKHLQQEVESTDVELFKNVGQKMLMDFDKAYRILESEGDSGLAYEVNQIQSQLESGLNEYFTRIR